MMAFPRTPSPQGFAPHPTKGASPLWKPLLSLAAGQRGKALVFPPCGVAYGASHAARGKGRVRALLAPYPPSLRSVRYRSHPLQLHRGSIQRAYHDVVSRFGVADRRRRLDLDTSRAQNANAPEGKDNRLFPPAQRRASKWGAGGFAPCWGVGQSPASTKFNERSEWQNTL